MFDLSNEVALGLMFTNDNIICALVRVSFTCMLFVNMSLD